MVVSRVCEACNTHVLFEESPLKWDCEVCGNLNGYSNKELMKRNDAGEIVSGSIEDTLLERGARYGDFEDQSHISQQLKATIAYGISKNREVIPSYIQESIDMICNKLGRIANGDPYYDDSWRDIAGYAQLVVDILNKGK